MEIVFGRGVYVDENTSQAANVEFVCKDRQIMRAADCKDLAKKPKGFSAKLKTACLRRRFCDYCSWG